MMYSKMLTTEQVLTYIDKVRGSESEWDKKGLLAAIRLLQARQVYPRATVHGNGKNVLEMVLEYGARWYQFQGELTCPLCLTDLRDHVGGPPFLRVESISNEPCGADFQCPDCSGVWAKVG